MRALEPWHLLILPLVVLLLFGGKRLPDAARGLGRSLRIFKSEVKQMQDESPAPDDPARRPTRGPGHRGAPVRRGAARDHAGRAPRRDVGPASPVMAIAPSSAAAITTEGRMALREHLVELRRRLTFADCALALGVAAASVAGWFLYEPVFEAIGRPSPSGRSRPAEERAPRRDHQLR